MLSILSTILIFLIVIGVVIMIHEFGHFLAAKLSGMLVEELNFGFGPRLFGKKIGETTYGIRLFPIGGYAKILGEEENVKSKRSYNQQPLKNRVFVIIAGIVMNLILAVILFYVVLIAKGFQYSNIPYYPDLKVIAGTQEVVYAYPPTVVEVIQGSPAEKAGLTAPVEIRKVDGVTVEKVSDLQTQLADHKDQTVDLYVCDLKNNCKDTNVDVNSDGKIGVALAEDYPVWKISYNGVEKWFGGFLHLANMVKIEFFVIGKLINQSIQEHTFAPISQTFASPIGIYALVDVVKKFGGIIGLVDLTAMLSLALAISNILPIPALDGGHLLFLGIEAVRGKPVSDKVKGWIFGIGMIFLIILTIVLAAKDIVQWGVWSWIRDRFTGLF